MKTAYHHLRDWIVTGETPDVVQLIKDLPYRDAQIILNIYARFIDDEGYESINRAVPHNSRDYHLAMLTSTERHWVLSEPPQTFHQVWQDEKGIHLCWGRGFWGTIHYPGFRVTKGDLQTLVNVELTIRQSFWTNNQSIIVINDTVELTRDYEPIETVELSP